MRHKWADVIEAYIDGKPIQTRRIRPTETWYDIFSLEEVQNAGLHFPNFNDSNVEWRIKPKMKKFRCRTALFRTKESGRYYAVSFDNEMNFRGEDPQEDQFVRWLTETIEFEVEDNEA